MLTSHNEKTIFSPASLWQYMTSLVYDLVIVVALVMVVGLASELITAGHLITAQNEVVIAWWYRPLQYLVIVAYFVVSWRRGGQTLGMRPWRIALKTPHGQPLSWLATIIRAGVLSLPLLLLSLQSLFSTKTAMLAALAAWIICFLPIFFSRTHRGIPDRIAGSALIQIKPSAH